MRTSHCPRRPVRIQLSDAPENKGVTRLRTATGHNHISYPFEERVYFLSNGKQKRFCYTHAQWDYTCLTAAVSETTLQESYSKLTIFRDRVHDADTDSIVYVTIQKLLCCQVNYRHRFCLN